ncbi:3'-5' exonuclease [Rubritalea spongiae]|uniref:3'-5' exonuclease n=1 Tax=Rubritalea spongiae TaxID=430797 RepID=A0ABW5DZK0_9BACT
MSNPNPSSSRPNTSPNSTPKKQRLTAPSKAETSLLPTFPGLSENQIHVPVSQQECQAAVDAITAAGVTGFDTEAKPTFRRGEKSSGPHVVQFALTDCAYLFQLHRPCCEKAAAKLIASEQLLKVGFGLKNDHTQIRSRFGIELKHVLDLDQVYRQIGYGRNIGVRGAIGVQLKQCFKKSKTITMSNWAENTLTPRQLVYAANDAYAALKIMESLQSEGLLE